jgi:hypothetical protein
MVGVVWFDLHFEIDSRRQSISSIETENEAKNNHTTQTYYINLIVRDSIEEFSAAISVEVIYLCLTSCFEIAINITSKAFVQYPTKKVGYI